MSDGRSDAIVTDWPPRIWVMLGGVAVVGLVTAEWSTTLLAGLVLYGWFHLLARLETSPSGAADEAGAETPRSRLRPTLRLATLAWAIGTLGLTIGVPFVWHTDGQAAGVILAVAALLFAVAGAAAISAARSGRHRSSRAT